MQCCLRSADHLNITAFPQFFVVPLLCRHLSASVLLSLSVRIEDKKSLSVLLVQTADPIVYQRRAFSFVSLIVSIYTPPD